MNPSRRQHLDRLPFLQNEPNSRAPASRPSTKSSAVSACWRARLRSRGVTYLDVLGGLGDLGLRPPLVPMEGPNVEARERGTRRLRELLARPEAVKRTYTLIVTDTSPVITLALAGELDLLLRLGTPVSIPDAVFNEATCVRTAGGARAIVEWVNAHADLHIAPTEVGIDQQRRLEEGRSTRGFLRELEAAHLIQSTDRILDVAAEAGRNMRRDDSVRGALQEQLRKTEEAYAKYHARKQDDPATAKDRDR
jgi:hypothetical protein